MPQPELTSLYETYLPQILCLYSHSLWPEPHIPLTVGFAKLVANYGVFMWHNRQVFEGEKVLRTARDILEAHGSTDTNPVIGDIDSTLSYFADTIGISRRKDSIRWRESAVKARETEYASIPPESRTINDHIRFYNSKTSLACCYLQDEKAEEGITLMEECLEAYRSWGTEEQYPFEYSKYYNYIAMAFMQLGRTAKGVEFSKRACELQVAHSGPHGRMSLSHYFILGNHYCMHGDIKSALEINIRVLQNRRRVCGESNMETLESYSMTGALYFLNHQPEKARSVKLFQVAFEANMGGLQQGPPA